MQKLELNHFEYNVMLKAIEKEYYEKLDSAVNEKPLTKREKEMGLITYKQSAEQTYRLLEKLWSFTSELNHHFDAENKTGRSVYLIQK